MSPYELHINPDEYEKQGPDTLKKAQVEARESGMPNKKLIALMLAGMSAFTACGFREPTRKGDVAKKGAEYGEAAANAVTNFVGGLISPATKPIGEFFKNRAEADKERLERWKAEWARQAGIGAYDTNLAGPLSTDQKFVTTIKNQLVLNVRLPGTNGWTEWILRPNVGSDAGFHIEVSDEKKNALFAEWKKQFEVTKGRKMRPSEERVLWRKAYDKLKKDVLDQIGGERAALGLDVNWGEVPVPTTVDVMYSNDTARSYDDAPGVVPAGLTEYEGHLPKGVVRKGIRFQVTDRNQGQTYQLFFVSVEVKDKLQP